MKLVELVEAVRKAACLQSLIESHGDLESAAKRLGVSRRTLYSIVEQHNLWEAVRMIQSGRIPRGHKWPMKIGGLK